ncbi:hypothetical protein PISMIDRAFT_117578 [Pisolithus microcarpus 441]|uniref:HAT C-terminal dimerisation domain-containing protein n=1 Tax=Pisolithus microcarpus 441 TaxID=765257 RepID=A0A0C9Z295_9AGAM|nr:hypothetical protein PISMIDRAFT_117578 [Pisolithus microcarpus 441]
MSGESTPKLGGAVPAFETFMEEWKRLSNAVPHCAAYIKPGLAVADTYYKKMGKTKAYVITMYQVPCTFPKPKLASYYYRVAPVDTWHANNLGPQTVDQEFSTYVTASISPPGSDPLSFWQLSRTTYPTIFCITMDYLPIQASSVPHEHIFSSSSGTTTKCQNCISPILMEALQMLKFFLKKECLDFSKGWAVLQKDMLVDEDDDDLLAAIVDKNASEDSLAQAVDIIISTIAGDEGDETEDVPLIF